MDCFGLSEFGFMITKHIDYGRNEVKGVSVLEDPEGNQTQKSSDQTDDVSKKEYSISSDTLTIRVMVFNDSYTDE